jgi:CelD/BcsL family acetyltransferase involved in cellulose biosynthesis
VGRRSGLRVLTWAGQLFSDYCDCLLDPARPPTPLLTGLWDGLRGAGGFDLVSLQQVRPDARCLSLFNGLSKRGAALHPGDRQERCMRIENRWPNGEAFFRSLNKKARNNHTRGKRILTELGGEPAFRVVQPSEAASALLDEIWRLKETWLRAVEPDSTLLGSDRFVLRSILDAAWKTGLARIFLLECGGKIAAASVNFIYGNRMEAYLTSYDPAFERASPGTILITEYAKWSFDRGLAHVDFLRGEEAFKFRMANAETVLVSFEGSRTLAGQLAIVGHRWLSRRRPRAEAPAVAEGSELEVA